MGDVVVMRSRHPRHDLGMGGLPWAWGCSWPDCPEWLSSGHARTWREAMGAACAHVRNCHVRNPTQPRGREMVSHE